MADPYPTKPQIRAALRALFSACAATRSARADRGFPAFATAEEVDALDDAMRQAAAVLGESPPPPFRSRLGATLQERAQILREQKKPT